jgi:hypothetical protein
MNEIERETVKFPPIWNKELKNLEKANQETRELSYQLE